MKTTSDCIGIREYLLRRGLHPHRETATHGMFLSPLREERTPSFSVRYDKGLWYDFGLGEGGTLLQLVMRLEGCGMAEAIRSLREISVNLSPHILNDFGLARAVSNFINKLPRSSMRINYSTNLRTERFDMDIEVILYRVICELINNSLKHSGATQITISLIYADETLRLDYRDNGCGFDISAQEQQGMGIVNIRSRIRSLKGIMEMKSTPGKGMAAQIEVHI